MKNEDLVNTYIKQFPEILYPVGLDVITSTLRSSKDGRTRVLALQCLSTWFDVVSIRESRCGYYASVIRDFTQLRYLAFLSLLQTNFFLLNCIIEIKRCDNAFKQVYLSLFSHVHSFLVIPSPSQTVEYELKCHEKATIFPLQILL